METTVIHNVPYYIDPKTNALYTYNEDRIHVGSYDPTTHNVFYEPAILADPRLLVALSNARAATVPTNRKK
jgi:hypothetical protein